MTDDVTVTIADAQIVRMMEGISMSRRLPRRATAHRAWVVILCPIILCACGQGSSSPAAGAPIEPTSRLAPAPPSAPAASDPALTPLTSADIQLYLAVMRDAAALIQHPTAADIAARKRAQDLETSSQQQQAIMEDADRKSRAAMQAAMAAAQRGDLDAAKAAQTTAQKALNNVSANIKMPTPAEQVADMRVMQLDDGSADEYVAEQRHINSQRWDAIVDAVETAIPDPDAAHGDGDPLDHPYVPSDHERKVAAVTAINRKTLAPDRSEIFKLMAAVRHPQHTP